MQKATLSREHRAPRRLALIRCSSPSGIHAHPANRCIVKSIAFFMLFTCAGVNLKISSRKSYAVEASLVTLLNFTVYDRATAYGRSSLQVQTPQCLRKNTVFSALGFLTYGGRHCVGVVFHFVEARQSCCVKRSRTYCSETNKPPSSDTEIPSRINYAHDLPQETVRCCTNFMQERFDKWILQSNK